MIELERHIEILLLTNDCVIIPGFGGFMTHYVEARKDERDFAFLPPKRTVGFNEKLVLNDSLLAQSYVEVYDISYPDAVARIEDEVRELRQHLDHESRYEMNGIGTLRLNEEGHMEFEPCSSGILTPSLYGLGYYDLKTVAQLEHEQLKDADGQAVASAKNDSADGSAATIVAYDGDEKRSSRLVALWRNLAVACIAFIAFLLLPAPLANNDNEVVMSKINTQLLDYVMPKEQVKGEAEMREAVTKIAEDIAVKAEEKAEATEKATPAESYSIVLAARVAVKNAEDYVARLHKEGYDSARVVTEGSSTKVVYGMYTSREEAVKTKRELVKKKEFESAWITKN